MKRKEDDLYKIDGVYIPPWAKVLAFIVAFGIAFCVFYFIIPMITGA